MVKSVLQINSISTKCSKFYGTIANICLYGRCCNKHFMCIISLQRQLWETVPSLSPLTQPLWKTVWSYLKKRNTKNRSNIRLCNPIPGNISRENANSKRYMYPYIHSSTIYNSQDMEATQVSIKRWTNKEDVGHIYCGILLSHKNEWNNVICSNMDRLGGYYSKWNKLEKDKCCMISLMCI